MVRTEPRPDGCWGVAVKFTGDGFCKRSGSLPLVSRQFRQLKRLDNVGIHFNADGLLEEMYVQNQRAMFFFRMLVLKSSAIGLPFFHAFHPKWGSGVSVGGVHRADPHSRIPSRETIAITIAALTGSRSHHPAVLTSWWSALRAMPCRRRTSFRNRSLSMGARWVRR